MTRRRPRSGAALILALLVVTLLTVTVVPFVYDGRVEQAVAANLYAGLQAGYLASGGVVLADAVLRRDALEDRAPNARSIDYPGEDWARLAALPIAAGGGAVRVVITDERGKLPLNPVAEGQQTDQWRRALERHLQLQAKLDAGQAAQLLDALVDWIDANNETTGAGGAEAAYYQSLDPPGQVANARLTTVAELRLVKGWTGQIVDAVAPFVTVYPARAGQVNPNTAPAEVLVAIGLDESQAAAAVEMRVEQPFTSAQDFRARTGANPETLPPMVFRSDFFGVSVTASFRDSVHVVRTVLQRREGRPATRLYWRAE